MPGLSVPSTLPRTGETDAQRLGLGGWPGETPPYQPRKSTKAPMMNNRAIGYPLSGFAIGHRHRKSPFPNPPPQAGGGKADAGNLA